MAKADHREQINIYNHHRKDVSWWVDPEKRKTTRILYVSR
jgi:hypothetical protein